MLLVSTFSYILQIAQFRMNDLMNFYKGKSVFITGHTGFKGAWLTQILLDAGAEVHGYSLIPNNDQKHFDMLGLRNKIETTFGDIRDPDLLSVALKESKPEIVFHLAAQALVRKSYEDPAETYETNVMGSLNLLQSVRGMKSIKSLVYITSDKCYENQEWSWGYREIDALGGVDPYSSSKACAEILFSSFQRSFLMDLNLSAASARAGNVIGGGDWSQDRIIPDCIRAAETNSELRLRNPKATRPWQHVLEPLSGYLGLAQKLYEFPGKFEGSWNFGPSTQDVLTVEQVAQTILKAMGAGLIDSDTQGTNPHEANLLQLNCEKSRQELGWSSRWNVETTIAKTAEWYKLVASGIDALEVTRSQIQDYFGGHK
jgi:CDP-glucose 4,6-dehydratase